MTGPPTAAGRNLAASPSRFERFKTKHRKSFIVDIDGALMQRHAQLSRGARALYSTLRALADGKTGKLAVNDRPLDWHYICRQAEISRCTWLKRFKELVVAGLAGSERRRVLRVIKGRKRVVLGRACYFVRRQAIAPEITENQPNLLKSTFSTVEEVDPQINQNHQQGCVARSVSSGCRRRSGSRSEEQNHNHHRSRSSKPDDDFVRPREAPKTNPEMLQSDAAIAQRYDDRVDGFRKTVLRNFEARHPVDVLNECLDIIEGRAFERAISIGSVQYLTVALENLLANEKEFNEIFDRCHARRLRREKFMPDFDMAAYSDVPDPELTRKLRDAIAKKNLPSRCVSEASGDDA
jgi:hypothetical protein